LILLPGVINKKLMTVFYLFVLLFVVDHVQQVFIAKTFFSRIILLAESAFMLWLVIKFRRKEIFQYISSNPSFQRTARSFAQILIVLLIITIQGNLFGYTNLSLMLTYVSISAIVMAVFLVLMVLVLNSLVYGLMQLKIVQTSNIVRNREHGLRTNFHILFKYFAIFLWIRSVLNTLGLVEQVGDWLLGLMDTYWKVGSVEISIGGIISFFIVIFFTWILLKVLKILLEEEVYPRIRFPRGVPGTISMVISYIIVAFGAYIAISFAGVDLGKFGLIAGALGVGIGFGLQGLVYNFIAGLVLAFERPIQKGDTIEIGKLMGDVKSIGVRSSRIKTYDGSEVIVPNGNLISNEVINWTLTDRKRRRVVPVNVAYDSDPRIVMDLLFKVAEAHPEVLKDPKPWPLFDGFGDSALKFRILFWVDFDRGLSVQSEVAMNIYDALQDDGIQIPFPQQELTIKNLEEKKKK
ncbi:MAG: mechanosensitive ion channel, partial [Bacteroidales bacterium]|nr:mechanosensitive ion channel [Bacteroidales bacterium]